MSERIAAAIKAELKRQADQPGELVPYIYFEDEHGISVEGYVDIPALAKAIAALG